MGVRTVAKPADDLDGLRLLAMSRIPRCGACPRFRSLVEAHAGDRPRSGGLPAVPSFCSHQVCAPLVARWDPRRPSRRVTDRLSLRAS